MLLSSSKKGQVFCWFQNDSCYHELFVTLLGLSPSFSYPNVALFESLSSNFLPSSQRWPLACAPMNIFFD